MNAGTRARGNVGIAGSVDDALSKDGFTPRLAFGDDANKVTVFDDGRHAQTMQQRHDAGFFHHDVRYPLKHLSIQRMAERLRLGHGGAHGFGAFFELDANAFAVDGFFVAVPGKTFDAHLGNVAAEAAVTLQQSRLGAGTRCCQRCGQAARPTAHDQHVRLENDVDGTRCFVNFFHG